MTALLHGAGLSRRFGGVQAVDDISLLVPRRSVFGIIGPNGAGKTTLVNLITGHERADRGSVTLDGAALTGLPVHRIAALGVARTFQNLRLYRDLSALDNVIAGGHLRRRSDLAAVLVPTGAGRSARRAVREEAAGLLRLVGLDPTVMGEQRAGTLAYGDQRRVEIARALAARPKLLILDEPAAGMNRTEKDRLRSLFELLVRDHELTLVLIEHDVRLVMDVCDRVAVLDFGVKVAEGDPTQVAADPTVIAAYLGARSGASAAREGPPVAAHSSGPAPAQGSTGAPARGPSEAPTPRSSPMQQPVLEVEDLHVRYGAVHAVQGVSFAVGEGELVALVGANGAGKSSILRALSGITPARGSARYGGLDLLAASAPAIVRSGLVHVPEGREILARLTVAENLALGGWARRDRHAVAREIDEAFERFPVLGQRRDLPAGQLSGGEQQVLAVARALLARPSLLLLDEPSLGLAPKLADEVLELVRAINADGISVLLVEQNAYRALELADRAWVIETGQVALTGTGAELLQDERVKASYLGG